ncbi:MAG: DUF6596 domain-containing protein [Sandaracinaceae bacterium]
MSAEGVEELVERLMHEQGPSMVARLVSKTRDIELAADVVQEAWIVALQRWPAEGIPERPSAWIHTVALRRALDVLRRRGTEKRALEQLKHEGAAEPPTPERRDPLRTDQLGLLFAVCHPGISAADQVALALRAVAGLHSAEVARAFSTTPEAMRRRLSRASAEIREFGLEMSVPEGDELGRRAGSVMATLYLVFNEGYAPSRADAPIRPQLCEAAIRLGLRVMKMLPRDPEASALVALMMLHHARRDARQRGGVAVLLRQQDRSLYRRGEIARARTLLERAMRAHRPGPYQVQAAIAALHAEADSAEATDWAQISALYGALLRYQPTPAVEMNAAIAFGMAGEHRAALDWLNSIGSRAPDTRKIHLFHAARAEFLMLLDESGRAADALREAQQWASSPSDQKLLLERIEQLRGKAIRRRRRTRRALAAPEPLSDAAWGRVRGLFPARTRGRPARSDRMLVNAVLWVLATGQPWRALPSEFGPWKTAYSRFRRWESDGTMKLLLSRLGERYALGRAAQRSWRQMSHS